MFDLDDFEEGWGNGELVWFWEYFLEVWIGVSGILLLYGVVVLVSLCFDSLRKFCLGVVNGVIVEWIVEVVWDLNGFVVCEFFILKKFFLWLLFLLFMMGMLVWV